MTHTVQYGVSSTVKAKMLNLIMPKIEDKELDAQVKSEVHSLSYISNEYNEFKLGNARRLSFDSHHTHMDEEEDKDDVMSIATYKDRINHKEIQEDPNTEEKLPKTVLHDRRRKSLFVGKNSVDHISKITV